MWKTSIDKAIEEDVGLDGLNAVRESLMSKYGMGKDFRKNSLFIGYLMSELWDRGIKSQTLEKLVENIIKFSSDQEEQRS